MRAVIWNTGPPRNCAGPAGRLDPRLHAGSSTPCLPLTMAAEGLVAGRHMAGCARRSHRVEASGGELSKGSIGASRLAAEHPRQRGKWRAAAERGGATVGGGPCARRCPFGPRNLVAIIRYLGQSAALSLAPQVTPAMRSHRAGLLLENDIISPSPTADLLYRL